MLGHVVSSEGIYPEKGKVQEVVGFKIPKCVRGGRVNVKLRHHTAHPLIGCFLHAVLPDWLAFVFHSLCIPVCFQLGVAHWALQSISLVFVIMRYS